MHLFGAKNGMYGKRHSPETLRKIGAFGLGKHWFNNEKIEVFEQTCPDGFKPGRLKR